MRKYRDIIGTVMDIPKKVQEEERKTWSLVGFAWDLGYSIAIPLILFVVGGVFIDRELESSPMFLLTGVFFSIFLSSMTIYKKTKSIIDPPSNGTGGVHDDTS